jgi:hypothetical protein
VTTSSWQEPRVTVPAGTGAASVGCGVTEIVSDCAIDVLTWVSVAASEGVCSGTKVKVWVRVTFGVASNGTFFRPAGCAHPLRYITIRIRLRILLIVCIARIYL